MNPDRVVKHIPAAFHSLLSLNRKNAASHRTLTREGARYCLLKCLSRPFRIAVTTRSAIAHWLTKNSQKEMPGAF
jgi:hypothetical protein